MCDLNNEIIRILDPGPLPKGSRPAAQDGMELRSGWYLVAAPVKTKMASLFGPFPSRSAARFFGTSARSLGLMVPG